jgi:hypothetical protein
MYRIGDKVEVINACNYHNWSVGVIATISRPDDPLELLSVDDPNGITHQALYPRDVRFVSRVDYIPDDYAIVIGHSYQHSIPIGTKVKVISMQEHVADPVVSVVHEEEHLYQGVHPDNLLPIEFADVYTEGLSASSTTFEPLTTESLMEAFTRVAEQTHGMGANYNTQGFIPVETYFSASIDAYPVVEAHPVSYARAVPNDVVTVHAITDRPRCEDDSLFTEFTSWQHALTDRVRGVGDGLVIDACTVITFLGTNDRGDDIFSIRYEDTGNIVIAKGKLNNGYAKYVCNG